MIQSRRALILKVRVAVMSIIYQTLAAAAASPYAVILAHGADIAGIRFIAL
jgi:hypothetical protein